MVSVTPDNYIDYDNYFNDNEDDDEDDDDDDDNSYVDDDDDSDKRQWTVSIHKKTHKFSSIFFSKRIKSGVPSLRFLCLLYYRRGKVIIDAAVVAYVSSAVNYSL